jgi:nucleoid-associated protein YgaU
VLTKGILYNADTGQPVVTCQFNPNELTINRQNQWQADSGAGSDLTRLHFGGGSPQQLQMTLLFDAYEDTPAADRDVTRLTNKVLSLMEATETVADGGQAGRSRRSDRTAQTGRDKRPPHVRFGWGHRFSSFRAVITQVSQRFTLFLESGAPVRATLQLTLQEVAPEPVRQQGEGQNPTSRAAGARRVRVVRPGDTIDWLASVELGDPTAWRLLAEANGLEDPRRLRAGQTLFVPPEP